ncbi:MAG: tRNA (adenosine(37)-N6)-dimethylallyltransferase MiaA [Actinomycetota bacterium]|nr:tRNA (adenosine(37)-N6)-dimethylallyltransferase MiaA [Actinomycetota bacterium]
MAPVLALVGPTATGKTGVALEVARARGDVEIVAADAFTVYVGMDVGTAKPSLADRVAVPHHLVDVLDPGTEATVAWFQDAARTAIEEVHARGRLPLLVGGSGLYFRAVVDDLRFPPTDPEVRAAIEARHRDAPEAAHEALHALDPDAAARIDPTNLRRTVRALEVIELTGERFSSFARAWDRYEPIYPDLEVLGLDLESSELRQRIEARARTMVAEGLVEEARRLQALPRPLSTTARQAIGYAEALAVLAGRLAEHELAPAIARRTMRYARRQRSWFRADPRVLWTRPEEAVAAWT